MKKTQTKTARHILALGLMFIVATTEILGNPHIRRPHPLPFQKGPVFHIHEKFTPEPLPPTLANEQKRCPKTLDHLKHHQWKKAFESSYQKCLTLNKLSLWHSLYHGGIPSLLDAYIMFMAEQNWPMQTNLSINLEKLATHIKQDAKLANWFRHHPPKTASGKIAFAKALHPVHDRTKLHALITDLWQNTSLSQKQFDEVRKTFHVFATPEMYRKRLQSMLWRASIADLKIIENHLNMKERKIASFCRNALQKKPGTLAMWETLPPDDKHKPIVLYYLAKWKRQTRHKDMFAFWNTHKKHIKIDDHDWWKEIQRSIFAGFHLGKHKEIHQLVNMFHPQGDAGNRASSLWLKGWINLKSPDKSQRNPTAALKQFGEIYEFAKFPTTKSQAAYWAGKAATELKNERLAKRWFMKAAGFTTTYYGQLASDILNQPYDVKLSPWRATDETWFQKRPSTRAIRDFIQLLARIDEGWEVYDCLVSLLYKAENPSQALGVLAFAQKNYPPAFVFASRVAMSRFGLQMQGYFPVLPPKNFTHEVDPALVHAVIHRESSFLHPAVSHAGAIGLMQLMPYTAKDVGKKLGIKINHASDLKKPHLNMRLGQHYLHQLMERYEGCLPLVLGAYNAGPNNVDTWVKALGNPCKDSDINTWIESVPFTETRHYIKSILASYRIYQLLLVRK